MTIIAAAAIQFEVEGPEGDYPTVLTVSAPRPARHHSIMHPFSMTTGIRKFEQGFITDEGQFVDREVGYFIAHHAGQIRKKHGVEGTLYSEDMW